MVLTFQAHGSHIGTVHDLSAESTLEGVVPVFQLLAMFTIIGSSNIILSAHLFMFITINKQGPSRHAHHHIYLASAHRPISTSFVSAALLLPASADEAAGEY